MILPITHPCRDGRSHAGKSGNDEPCRQRRVVDCLDHGNCSEQSETAIGESDQHLPWQGKSTAAGWPEFANEDRPYREQGSKNGKERERIEPVTNRLSYGEKIHTPPIIPWRQAGGRVERRAQGDLASLECTRLTFLRKVLCEAKADLRRIRTLPGGISAHPAPLPISTSAYPRVPPHRLVNRMRAVR